MPLYGQWSGSPRRFNALSCFNSTRPRPALFLGHVVASRSLPQLLRALPAQPSREAARCRYDGMPAHGSRDARYATIARRSCSSRVATTWTINGLHSPVRAPCRKS
jgi:hypothetical protein